MAELANELSVPRARRLFVEKIVKANCLASDVAGDCVTFTADRVGALYQVTKADPRNISQGPSIGIIRSKEGPTVCIVQLLGVIDGLYTGLTIQVPLWVGTDGKLTQDVSSVVPLPAGRVFVQQMAVAMASDVIFFNPQGPVIRIA